MENPSLRLIRIIKKFAISHLLFAHNNKYFLLKLWGMIKNMKTVTNKLFFFFKLKKLFLFYRLKIFFNLPGKEKRIEVRLHVLKHYPKFQLKIFSIVDEKWETHNYSYGNYPKCHMPLISNYKIRFKPTLFCN